MAEKTTSYEAVGILKVKGDTEAVSDKFSKREFVIEIAGQYPQSVKFQLTQDYCSQIEPFHIGQEIKVRFDLRGREWSGKYFVNLQCWKIEKVGQQNAPQRQQPQPQQQQRQAAPAPNYEAAANNDDLPF